MIKSFLVLSTVLSLFSGVEINNIQSQNNEITTFGYSNYNVYLRNRKYGQNGIYLNVDFTNTNKVWSDDFADFKITAGFNRDIMNNNATLPENNFQVRINLELYFTYFHEGKSIGSYIYNDYLLDNKQTFYSKAYNHNEPIFASQFASVGDNVHKEIKLNTFLKHDGSYGYYDSHWAYSVTLKFNAKYFDKYNNLYKICYNKTLRF